MSALSPKPFAFSTSRTSCAKNPIFTFDFFLLPSGVPYDSSSVPYHERLSHLYVTGRKSLIQFNPMLKSVMSALSLESEDEIEVSAQYKSVILSSPRTATLL